MIIGYGGLMVICMVMGVLILVMWLFCWGWEFVVVIGYGGLLFWGCGDWCLFVWL